MKMGWRGAIIALVLSLTALSGASAQTAIPCDVDPNCEKKPETQKPKFEFEIRLRPVLTKPKFILKPSPKVKSATVNKPTKIVPPKTAAVQKPRKPKLKPQAAVLKPPLPSWIGLTELPVTKLIGDDFADIAGQYIVDLNPAAFAVAGLDLLTITQADLASRLGIAPSQIRSIQRRFMLSVVLRASPEEAAAMARNPLVRTVHVDTKIKAAGGTTPRPLSWGLDRLDLPSLPLDGQYDSDAGDYQTRLYLFDSGVDRRRAEFEGRVKFGANFVQPIPDTSGKCREHGTEMASLIGGHTTGSARKAEIVDIVVLPCTRSKTGAASSLIEGAEWLLIREADAGDGRPAVANMSLAGKWSRKINDAVLMLTNNGVAVVVAAGNNADDACRYSPASAKDAVTVAATGPNDETPGFSNYGQCVDIHAPGRLLTAVTEGIGADEYVASSGTSGAAALVSGLLMRSLKVKGPKAASQWLQAAAAPSQFWRKGKPDFQLAQSRAAWRYVCRVDVAAGPIKLRARPGPAGKELMALPVQSLVLVEETANDWVRVTVADGIRGWIAVPQKGLRILTGPDKTEPCEALSR